MDQQGVLSQPLMAADHPHITIRPVEAAADECLWRDVTYHIDEDMEGHEIAIVIVHPAGCDCKLPQEDR
jgi:hypothetical protein